jgi:hypothetical protein
MSNKSTDVEAVKSWNMPKQVLPQTPAPEKSPAATSTPTEESSNGNSSVGKP